MMLQGQIAPAGKLTTWVVDQTEVWQDLHGNVHQLDDMDTSHLANLEGFLIKHSEPLRWRWLEAQSRRHHVRMPTVIAEVDGKSIESWGPDGCGFPLWSDDGGNLDMAFREWVDFEMDRPLAEWLADRPLIKRIREIIDGRPDKDGPTFDDPVPF